MKAIGNLAQYSGVLPYASEIFGIYQPLLGWRSQRTVQRMESGFRADTDALQRKVRESLGAQFTIALAENRSIEKITLLKPALDDESTQRNAGSFVLDAIAKGLPQGGGLSPEAWDAAIDADTIERMMNEIVIPNVMGWYQGRNDKERNDDSTRLAASQRGREQTHGNPFQDDNAQVAAQLDAESRFSAYVLHLKATRQYAKLERTFFSARPLTAQLKQLLRYRSPLEMIDPQQDIARVGLSPIGIVHLFRQYFFELDTFLGSPVSHIWLSPGSSVELIEVSTRRTYVERTTESETTNIVKTDSGRTEEDEISEAVKEDNKADTKFGVSATVNQGWVGGSATATSSIELNATHSKARETSHRRMRQQTEKLSTEIRKNFKSTFKTITETTDTSSKRYMLNNTTQNLLNYEMRRKMRQVGVQLQDIGTYLCWQTYVDDPGRQLGIAEMVHLAKGPEVGATPPPEAIPYPAEFTKPLVIDIDFVQRSEDRGDLDESYKNGREEDTDTNEGDVETIQAGFGPFLATADQPGYRYSTVSIDYMGNDVEIEVSIVDASVDGQCSFNIYLRHVNFRGNSPMRVTANVRWVPTDAATQAINEKNKAKQTEFSEATRLEHEKAFVDAARERIEFMSRIESRPFDDLREEERIVVYRKLIQEMLTRDIPQPDGRTQHVVAELLNTIFDVDKMLYFVAPEWWRPRLHRSGQTLGALHDKPAPAGKSDTKSGSSAGKAAVHTSAFGIGSINRQVQSTENSNLITAVESDVGNKGTTMARSDTVSWGGEHRSHNYYITEKSAPAKLGSSLGWLLQLDGDNLRNAFLNAPWVKAVIPIRPGMERAAMSWLQGVGVEGTDGLDNDYIPANGEDTEIPHIGTKPTIRDAISHLCDVVAKKHVDANLVKDYQLDATDDASTVSATPVDKVFEKGFDPLRNGFRVAGDGSAFEVFDQWVEILPTDQIVPVPVDYDPKTGRQRP